MSKLSLTLTRDDGMVLDKWTSDDKGDRAIFDRLASTVSISTTTAQRIYDSYLSSYWVKETRTYLIKAHTEEHALNIFNSLNFDDDSINLEVEVGFEI